MEVRDSRPGSFNPDAAEVLMLNFDFPQPALSEALRKDLIQFGLDPRDWRIEKIDDERWSIRHEDDKDFRLLGRIASACARPRWSDIQLVSL